MAEQITGVVDQITFYSEESGYGVVKIVPENPRPLTPVSDGTVTVVGLMPAFNEGDLVQFSGAWENNKRYGKQFKARIAVQRLPRTESEIVTYLSSERVKGIGPDTARKIVDLFGEATIEILDEDPHNILQVPGMKSAVVELFVKDWTENHAQRHMLTFLQQDLGFSARLARRIYTSYGIETRRMIRTDPYRLAADEHRTFRQADEIAKGLGVLDGHPCRLRAGMLQALNDFANDGHTFARRAAALAKAGNLLGVEDKSALDSALRNQFDDNLLIEDSFESDKGAKPIRAVYLPRYYLAENEVAKKLRDMAMRSSGLIHLHRNTDWTRFLTDLSQSNNLSLSSRQENAVRAALTSKVSVLTGGPGTGKTATLRMLVVALRQRGYGFQLAAPTGRAARRLSYATNNYAATIHRLLKWEPETDGFTYHEGNPLRTDIVVIDEASMLDLLLFNSLLKALELSTHLLLVGDIDQLPSVGAGNVLSDVMNSGIAKVTRLEQIFRQDENSHIASNAHLINMGQQPIIDNKSSDFFFFNIQDPEKVAENIVEIVKTKVPNKWPLYSARDIQVIAPMKRGEIGVNILNGRLQQELNGASKAEVRFRNRVLRVGDKVMQTRNDYDKEVFNGDIGFIQSIDTEKKSLKIRFDDGDNVKKLEEFSGKSDEKDHDGFLDPLPDSDLVTYHFSEADDLNLAYCITVHKSQGSEFPVVVMPIHLQQSNMLQRNLLYTAITRAKQLVVLVGTRDALQKAVDNDNVDDRHSGLLQRLRG